MKSLVFFVFFTLMNLSLFGSTTNSVGILYDAQTLKPIANGIITTDSKEYKTDENGSFTTPKSAKIGARAIGYERKFFATDGKMYLKPLLPKALYLSSLGATHSGIMGDAKKLLATTKLNALVIDIKMDRGQVAYSTTNPIANAIGAQKLVVFKDLKGFVENLKKENIYTIARIVAFKDSPYVSKFPHHGVKKENGEMYKDKEGLAWIDPSIEASWDYIIDIAEETASMGFDEIQFDYVRFPDRKGIVFSVPNTQEARTKAIASFLKTARKRLVPYNVFLSADIFGYVSWHNADIDIGQRIDTMLPYVDYLCPMLYPSGFHKGIPGYTNPVDANYEIVKHSLDKALQKHKSSPLAYRPWLQAFRDYAFDRRIYGAKEIGEQIKASEDFGSSGWILWNPRNVYIRGGL